MILYYIIVQRKIWSSVVRLHFYRNADKSNPQQIASITLFALFDDETLKGSCVLLLTCALLFFGNLFLSSPFQCQLFSNQCICIFLSSPFWWTLFQSKHLYPTCLFVAMHPGGYKPSHWTPPLKVSFK